MLPALLAVATMTKPREGFPQSLEFGLSIPKMMHYLLA